MEFLQLSKIVFNMFVYNDFSRLKARPRVVSKTGSERPCHWPSSRELTGALRLMPLCKAVEAVPAVQEPKIVF